MKHDRNSAGREEKRSKGSAAARLSERVGLPVDVLKGYPYLQLYGGRRLIIEGACRLLDYGDESLCAQCGKVRIRVSGRKINVGLMDPEALIVSGYIQSVSFEE